jgi:thaumarchaeosortase
MSKFGSRLKRHQYVVLKLVPLITFAIPLILLYVLNSWDPYLKISTQDSFQLMWKGRTFQLFFLWLVALEFILSWETIKSKIYKQNIASLIILAVASVLPTLYVVLESYFGLSGVIANAATQGGVTFYNSMPLATEYLVFSSLFCLICYLYLGKNGLKSFALPALFAALVGILYTIDNVFPYGSFTPFQVLVPTTASLAATTLGWMGYGTVLGTENGMPTLQATGSLGTAKFAIAWPCAGIESLLIFTAVALLFLKRMPISWKAKAGYFAVGAAITYFINILRIDSIFLIGMQYGVVSNEVQNFHFYYGPLYSIAWIVSYLLIIILAQMLWQKTKARNSVKMTMKSQSGQLSPV